MGKEIERKFLVVNDDWLKGAKGKLYIQGYLSTASGRTVRVRVANDTGFLTIKGKAQGISRAEYEYEIPLKDATELMELCEQPVIEKIRYKVDYAGHTWEVDVFSKDNAGLVVAEVELKSEDEKVKLPSWIGKEVSDDKRYSNSNLTKDPYKNWGK